MTMTVDAITAFRKHVNSDAGLQRQFAQAADISSAAMAELGRANGYVFSDAEALHELEQCLGDGELTDFELELVSAGGNPECAAMGSSGRNSNSSTQT